MACTMPAMPKTPPFRPIFRGLCAAWLLYSAAAVQALPGCPDVSGRYRVAGEGPEVGEALALLGVHGGFGKETDLQLKSVGDGSVLSLGVVPARDPEALPAQPRTLSRGAEFDCRDFAVVLRAKVPASRKTDSGYLEGESSLRLKPEGRSLRLELVFNGRERSTLYAYDSARVSVPKPFTARTLTSSLSWSPASALPPLPPVPTPAQRATERGENDLRARIESLVIGHLGVVKAEAGGTRVQLRSARAADVVATEDRLRAAGLSYEVLKEPLWYDGAHHSEILVRSGGSPGRPSAFRVAAELDRLMSGVAFVVKSAREGEVYVMQVDVRRDKSAAEAIARVVGRSALVDQVVPDGQARDYSTSEPRLLERWRVTLRR